MKQEGEKEGQEKKRKNKRDWRREGGQTEEGEDGHGGESDEMRKEYRKGELMGGKINGRVG